MEQVRQLYGLGVRHITPVHLMDNVFGSSAVYKDIFNYLNAWFHNRPFDVDDGTPLGVNFMPGRAILFPKFLFNIPTVPGFATGADLFRHGYTQTDGLNSPHKFAGYINKWGLDNYVAPLGGAPKPDARSMYREMMKLGMLIDIAHMSHRSVEDILNMTNPARNKGGNGYPVSSSHGGIRELSVDGHANERSLSEAQCREVLALGGTLGLGIGPESSKPFGSAVANDAPETSKSFAQIVQRSNALFSPASRSGGLTLGSDFNGLNGMMRPRFGPKAKSSGQTNGVRYGQNFSGAPVLTSQPPMVSFILNGQSGPRIFDFNTHGLAHAGMVPDMFQDARNVGLPPAQIGSFFRGAEDFLRMWEKCESLRSSIQ
jgi:microsomal dipeptidase-like Zn-dependent dipeptidase